MPVTPLSCLRTASRPTPLPVWSPPRLAGDMPPAKKSLQSLTAGASRTSVPHWRHHSSAEVAKQNLDFAPALSLVESRVRKRAVPAACRKRGSILVCGLMLDLGGAA